MKKILLSICGAILGYQAQAANGQLVTIRSLADNGINPAKILGIFEVEQGVTLSLDENVLVSYEEEGSKIRFDTLDHISVVVPIRSARGAENKVDGSGGAI